MSQSPMPFVGDDFKSLSPLSDECDNNTNSDDEFSEVSSLSPSTPNSPILIQTTPNSNTTPSNTPLASSPSTSTTSASATGTTKSLLPLIERPRRMTKREQLDRLDMLELAKKTRKLNGEEKKEFQRLRRRKQNRDAAATSRDRKRDYTSSLEGTIQQLRDKQAEMQRTIDNLLKERQALLKQAEQLDAQQQQSMSITSDMKDAECAKRGKKRTLSDCANESALSSVSSSSLDSSLALISSAELAGDGGGKSNQLENNVMMHITENVDQIPSQQHPDLTSLSVAILQAQVNNNNDNDTEPAAKRSKVEAETTSSSTSTIPEVSAIPAVLAHENDLASPASSSVAELTLDGLDTQLFDQSLANAESIGNLSALPASGSACDLLDSPPGSSFLPFTSLQREDSLGVGMCLAQDSLSLQDKAFAAHEFAFAAFNDLQTV